MRREADIKRIKAWLKEGDMTLDDVGVDGDFDTLSDEVIDSLLDSVGEDEAREAHRRYEEEESLRYAMEEE